MMKDESAKMTRRTALLKCSAMLAAIAVTVSAGSPTAFAADAVKKKKKASKDEFFFQEEPGENGKNCVGCINFTAKSAGQYGKDSGDCALLEGDVCTHCYCQGWTDKRTGKKAGT
jgi:hypothetical protein